MTDELAKQWLRALQLNANHIRGALMVTWESWSIGFLKEVDLTAADCNEDYSDEQSQLICTYEQAVHLHSLVLADDAIHVERVTTLYRTVSY